MSKGEGKKIAIQFTDELVGDVSGNEEAFTVTGKEYKYVNGPLIDMGYPIKTVERYPTLPQDKILLNFGDLNTERFNNVEGNITIKYDATKGNLSGRGGAVESFERSFLPTGLFQVPNPNAEEYVSVAPVEVVAVLNDVEYIGGFGNENITVAPFEVTVLLQDVGEINP